jgi:serine/threonine protein kinase
MGSREPKALGISGDPGSFQAPNTAAVEFVEAQSLIEQASDKLKRIHDAGHHELSAGSRSTVLVSLRSRLQEFLDRSTALIKTHQSMLNLHLGEISQELGHYPDADRFFRRACPQLSTLIEDRDIGPLLTHLANDPEKYHFTVVLDYLSFAVDTQEHLDTAEHLLKSLPWMLTLMPKVRYTLSEKRRILFNTIKALNSRHRYEEASKQLSVFMALFPGTVDGLDFGPLESERAIISAGMGLRKEARNAFIVSLAKSSVLNGLWHRQTLLIMYHFGRFSRECGNEKVASIVLEQCCRGTFYRFGTSHPISMEVFKELSLCKVAPEIVQELRRFGDEDHCAKNRLPVAYYYSHLHTIVDILEHIPGVDYVRLEEALQKVFAAAVRAQELDGLTFRRTIARCVFERGGTLKEALESLSHHAKNWEEPCLVDWDLIVERLELLSMYARSGHSLTAMDKSKALLLSMETLADADSHVQKIKAVHMRLAVLKLTDLGVVTTKPDFISEKDSEMLGAGAYASVDTVRIGKISYARKSVALPRYHQQQMRKAIQNEISIIRTLDHPHIIDIYLTYENKSRFFIIMGPLADCDLEAFLAQHTTMPSSGAQNRMVFHWLLCLSNTLAYIHSKGIRHKDIKPRNILVKGEELVFADFGSSHAFLDEGKSTTEGPSYGHTKMYCAPEVINQGRRNRSADVFSLGCVFTELVVWLPRCRDHDVSKWHDFRETTIDGITTNSYHASLDKIHQWFFEADRGTLPWHVYHPVLRKMLCRDSADRPTAVQVSQAISRMLYRTASTAGTYEKPNCTACRLDMWVDMNKHVVKGSATPSSSVHLPNTEEEPTSSSQSSKEYDAPEVPKNVESLDRETIPRRTPRIVSPVRSEQSARHPRIVSPVRY